MSRVRYRERQRLRTVDLQDEQNYLLGLDGRHNVGPHDWGIVRGLQILIEETGVATLFPGIAIDGYGRELVVAEAVPLDLSPNIPAHYVYLFYCERPRGQCGERPNTRVNDSVAIAVAEDLLPLPDEPDASLAREAGSLPDQPFWPVLLGVVNAGSPSLVDVSDVRYTRIDAGPIRHSTGRTAMRVGQESLIDPYHFLVTCRGEGGAMQNRMAIDRDGNLQFWNDVIVESTPATIVTSNSVVVASPIPSVNINTQAKSGSDFQVETATVSSAPNQFLQISFQGKNAKGDVISEQLLLNTNISRLETLESKLSDFTNDSKLVVLAITSQDLSTQEPSAPPSNQAQFEFGPGKVTFQSDHTDAKKEFCGCADPVEVVGRLPEGFVFLPGPNPPAVPSKDIYCIRTSAPNLPPVDNLRITGGPLREGDLAHRIVLGHSEFKNALYVFRPWLAFRGNGAIHLIEQEPDPPISPPPPKQVMLRVEGQLELAPVKPDPRDPVFNALSVLAFINGVLSLGAQLLTITFNIPAFIETEQDWHYDVTIKNETNEELLTVSGNSEVVTAGPNAHFGAVPGVRGLGPQATSTALRVNHTPELIGHDPTISSVTIEVKIAMKGRVTIAGSQTVGIPVIPSPEIDLSDIDPLAITSPPSSFDIVFRNRAGQQLFIRQFHSDGATFTPQPGPQTLAPHAEFHATITIPQFLSPPRVTITIIYRWSPGGDDNTLARSKDIEFLIA